MAMPELRFPPRISVAHDDELRALCADWAEDERVEGILFLGRAYDWSRENAGVDALVVARQKGPPAGAHYRVAVGDYWLRVRFATYREFLREVQDGAATSLKLALRDAFVAWDRRGRLADVLRAIEPALNEALPKARVAAAAQAAAALRDAEAALAKSSASDAAAALARTCLKLAELELLNAGAWPPDACPLAVYEESPVRRVFEAIWPAAGDVGELGRVYTDASVVFRRYLPAATAYIFDYLIKRGGSAALGSAVDALELAGILDVDLVFNALRAYGLIKIGKEERLLPGLPGAVYEEPVLTLP